MKRNSLTVAVCATLLALTIVLGWIPYGGLFLLPIIFAACCFGYGYSFIASVMFAGVSLAFTYMLPGSVFAIGALFRQYPWIAVVPRLFIGPMAHSAYILMKKLIKKDGVVGKVLPISVAAIVGTVTNTVLVGLCIYIAGSVIDPGLVTLSIIELVIAGSIELAVMAVVTPPVVLGVQKAMPKLLKEINAKRNDKADKNQKQDLNVANQTEESQTQQTQINQTEMAGDK